MDDLAARLAAIEATVAQLQAELAQRRGSMAQTLRCPACGCGSLFLIPVVPDNSGQHVDPASLYARNHVFADRERHGLLGAMVCRQCRLVELRATSLDGLVADGETVIEIETRPEAPAPSAGPFR